MSHSSTLSKMTPLSKEGIEDQFLNRAPITYSSYMPRMDPVFAGLITPPESPVQYVQRERSDDTAAQASVPLDSEANPNNVSIHGAQNAMEALFAAIRNTKADKAEQPDTIFSHNTSNSEVVPTSVTPIDFINGNKVIYSMAEQVVEEKMAEAMGALYLNIDKLDGSLASFHRENVDIRDQNDTMSRQLDLHYRTIEQHVEEFRSQSKTMNTMIGAQAENLAATISMVSHLSQVVTNLPMALNQVVHTAVQQQTQLAIRDIMFAQQQAMFSVSDVSETRRSLSSDGSSSHCTCNHHGLEIESVSSTQHDSGSTRHTSYKTSLKTGRGFGYTLRKLFKSSK